MRRPDPIEPGTSYTSPAGVWIYEHAVPQPEGKKAKGAYGLWRCGLCKICTVVRPNFQMRGSALSCPACKGAKADPSGPPRIFCFLTRAGHLYTVQGTLLADIPQIEAKYLRQIPPIDQTWAVWVNQPGMSAMRPLPILATYISIGLNPALPSASLDDLPPVYGETPSPPPDAPPTYGEAPPPPPLSALHPPTETPPTVPLPKIFKPDGAAPTDDSGAM